MSWICFQIELPQNKEQWEQKVKEECDRMLTQEAHEDNGFWYPGRIGGFGPERLPGSGAYRH